MTSAPTSALTSIDAALRQARRSIAAAEARQLLAQLLERPHAWLVAHGEALLSADEAQRYTERVARRAAGEPIAYLNGRREFYGRSFTVAPAVLIPRPETELLVERGLAALAGRQAPQILDLGCGSGCIGITLALELPQASVTAVDVSPPALALAERNASAHGVRLSLLTSDWFSALAGRSYDLIVANPPYIAASDPHLTQGDLRFEPMLALSSGADGLAAISTIVAAASRHLAPGASLLIEHGYDQAEALQQLFAAQGYREIEQWRDLAGILRVTGGRMVASALDARRRDALNLSD